MGKPVWKWTVLALFAQTRQHVILDLREIAEIQVVAPDQSFFAGDGYYPSDVSKTIAQEMRAKNDLSPVSWRRTHYHRLLVRGVTSLCIECILRTTPWSWLLAGEERGITDRLVRKGSVALKAFISITVVLLILLSSTSCVSFIERDTGRTGTYPGLAGYKEDNSMWVNADEFEELMEFNQALVVACILPLALTTADLPFSLLLDSILYARDKRASELSAEQ